MAVSFTFEKEHSPIFGTIHRPIAQVLFQHRQKTLWRKVTMIVDTGADHTILPRFMMQALGIDSNKDCHIITTQGVGGSSKVFFLKKKIAVQIGEYTRDIPLGFLEHDYVPPLLGRHKFLETFKVVFEKHKTTFF